ncbi:hypothetical protein BJY04DRAFT_213378 [Aspergillus karnatakaensis]|uniref:uncharacterized protein n=1 Tax=Aspergillus karnatakaensis TaxID=1810916 RepID=UPI003CCD6AD6
MRLLTLASFLVNLACSAQAGVILSNGHRAYAQLQSSSDLEEFTTEDLGVCTNFPWIVEYVANKDDADPGIECGLYEYSFCGAQFYLSSVTYNHPWTVDSDRNAVAESVQCVEVSNEGKGHLQGQDLRIIGFLHGVMYSGMLSR